MLTVRVVPLPGAGLRALLATTEIMVGTVAAHTWAGGTLPSVGWVAAVAALVLAASLVVLRGAVRPVVALPVLASAQVLLHCWLVALAPTHAMPGHHGSAAHLELTAPMLASHVAAAALTALVWWLRRRAVEVVLTWSAMAGVVVPSRRASSSTAPAGAPRRRHDVTLTPLRGPPWMLAPA